MVFVPPNNEHLLKSMPQSAQMRYQHFRGAAEHAAAERPELDHRIYTRFLGDYLNTAQVNTAALNQMSQNFKAQGVPIPGQLPALRTRERAMQAEFHNHFNSQIMPAYGQPGIEAWQVMNKKLDRGGPVEFAVKQVYNSEKGGLQIAGILGAILGGVMASKVFGGFGGGTLGIFSMIAGPLLGAYVLNRTLGAMNFGGAPKPVIPHPPAAPMRAPGATVAPTVTPPSPDVQAQARAAVSNPPPPAPTTPSHGTPIEPGMPLPAPSTPTVTPPAGGRTPLAPPTNIR